MQLQANICPTCMNILFDILQDILQVYCIQESTREGEDTQTGRIGMTTLASGFSLPLLAIIYGLALCCRPRRNH